MADDRLSVPCPGDPGQSDGGVLSQRLMAASSLRGRSDGTVLFRPFSPLRGLMVSSASDRVDSRRPVRWAG